MRFFGQSLLIILTLQFSACHNVAQEKASPALLIELNTQVKNEIEQAMLKIVGGERLILSDSLFVKESSVFIERSPSFSESGHLITSPERPLSYRFDLIKAGNKCILINSNSGEKFSITSAKCRTVSQ